MSRRKNSWRMKPWIFHESQTVLNMLFDNKDFIFRPEAISKLF